MDYIVFKQLAVALALSMLIGLEREQKSQKTGIGGNAGIRTFTLIGLSGALSYVLSEISVILTAVMSAGVMSLVLASYMSAKDKGLTSEIAAMIVYLIGVLSMKGDVVLAVSVALFTMALLHFKERLHGWSKKVKNVEITSTVKFILIAFVILPLLPKGDFGPYEFFNPYLVWLMVVFVSGLSFLSYFAIKVFGTKKGIGLSGFLGGFISTTALALSFADSSKRTPKIINPYVFAMMVAITGMFVRVLIEVSVLNSELVGYLLWPMIAMGTVSLAFAFLFWLRREKKKVKETKLELESPFSLSAALKFGALFAVILFFVEFANSVLGEKGLYITSFVSGIVDIDSITISVANLAGDTISYKAASIAIMIATIVNNLAKSFIILFLGSKKVALKVLMVSVLASVVGVGVLVFV